MVGFTEKSEPITNDKKGYHKQYQLSSIIY
jgi:hypothetical protein